jgi:hypothetical protein
MEKNAQREALEFGGVLVLEIFPYYHAEFPGMSPLRQGI